MAESQEDRVQRVEQLFLAARVLPAEDISPFLDAKVGDDAGLREEVESLLAFDRESTAFFERPVGETLIRGRRIGRFTLEQTLASGGMGVVYQARQDSPRRRVAVKVLRNGFGSADAERRFRHEADLLGLLEHPGIAKVYESGICEADEQHRLPYFALELIDGARAITDHVHQDRLDLRDRLALMAEVCDAVHHAHQKGVIHRDLKPANILVGKDGHPKIIDFGVARATNQDGWLTSKYTEVGQILGTVKYMSPEHCDEPRQVDTRSDVYSLGIVLYEMLCEDSPYEVPTHALLAAARVIRETPPRRPSSLMRHLPSDVETILLKPLEKHRDQRYQSAREFGEDLRAYLSGHPIRARPPTVPYLLSRIYRRNRTACLALAAAVFLLLAGLAGTSSGWIKASNAEQVAEYEKGVAIQERDRANTEVVRLERAMFFLFNMFNKVFALRGFTQETVAVINEAAVRLEDPRLGDPLLAARLHVVFAQSLSSMGFDEQTRRHLQRALEVFSAAGKVNLAFRCRLDLAVLDLNLSKHEHNREELARLEREMLELLDQASRSSDLSCRVNELRDHLGLIVNSLGRAEESRSWYQEVIEDFKLQLSTESWREYTNAVDGIGIENPRDLQVLLFANAVSHLAELHMDSGEIQQAVDLCESSLALLLEEERTSTLTGMTLQNVRGRAWFELAQLTGNGLDKAAEAFQLCREGHARLLGEINPKTLRIDLRLLDVLIEEDKEKAEVLLAEVLRKVEPMMRVDAARQQLPYGGVVRAIGLLRGDAPALAWLDRLISIAAADSSPNAKKVLEMRGLKGAILLGMDDLEQARSIMEESASSLRDRGGNPHWLLYTLDQLSLCYGKLGEQELAEETLLEALELLEEATPSTRRQFEAAILRSLVALYKYLDLPDEAAHYQAMLDGEGT